MTTQQPTNNPLDHAPAFRGGMIVIMLLRPRGLWPAPEHGKSLTQKT